MQVEKVNEIEQVCIVECSVPESQQMFQILFRMMQDKVVRRMIHAFHQFQRFGDDGGAVAPGKSGGEKAGDFLVGTPGKPMRYAHWVQVDKRLMIELVCTLVQEPPQVSCPAFLPKDIFHRFFPGQQRSSTGAVWLPS
jgi:hypothetical protein